MFLHVHVVDHLLSHCLHRHHFSNQQYLQAERVNVHTATYDHTAKCTEAVGSTAQHHKTLMCCKVRNISEWTDKISSRILHPNTVFDAQSDLIITLEAKRHAN